MSSFARLRPLCRPAFAALLALASLPAVISSAVAQGDLERARVLFRRTEYGAALSALGAVPGQDSAALDLAGRCHYLLGDFGQAVADFRAAAAADPGTSSHHLWLGRSYGRLAERASLVSAPGYALKAKASLEEAVALDPRNLEAASDLFEYYLEAPRLLGGGLRKASDLAEGLRRLDGAEYRWARARIAEKEGRLSDAENDLREATRLDPGRVGRVVDLAKFLAERGRYGESDAAFAEAERLAPESRRLWFERAKALVEAGRNLEDARRLLARYVQSSLTPDDPPREEAERLLRKLRSQ